MSDRNLEQRINIKFCVKIGKSATETLQMLKVAYGEDAMKKSSVFEWHKRFKYGREDVTDDPRSGQPKTTMTDVNVNRVRDAIRSDRRLSVRLIAEELQINRETVRLILTEELGMRKISSKFVPRILTDEQKQRRLEVATELSSNTHLFPRVITGDETWCFQYDPETKRQSMQWKSPSSPRPKKARMSRSQFKTMLVCFFDHKGIVHQEFIEQGQTVNQQCYLEVLKRVRDSVRRKRPELWPEKWIIHHDNAPSHTAFTVRDFLTKKSITQLDYPAYSPDLAPCDFWLFSKLKAALKGRRFSDITDVQQNVKQVLKSIPENEFQDCFLKWERRLSQCIVAQGEYFEGESSH